jgi:hypothetical protein
LNEKSRITPKLRGLAAQENRAGLARAEADTFASTAATASTGTVEAALMSRPSLLARADQVVE